MCLSSFLRKSHVVKGGETSWENVAGETGLDNHSPGNFLLPSWINMFVEFNSTNFGSNHSLLEKRLVSVLSLSFRITQFQRKASGF